MSKEIKNKKIMADIKNEFIKSYTDKISKIYGNVNNKAFTVLNMYCFSELDLANKNSINDSYTDGDNDEKIDAIVVDDKRVVCIQSTVSSNFKDFKEKYEVFLSRVKDLFFNEDPKILKNQNISKNIKNSMKNL